MAYYIIYPEKDATIYGDTDRINLNSGQDEILELIKIKQSNGFYGPSRILIKFDDTEINQALSLIPSSSTYSASLRLYSTEHKNLAKTQSLELFPLAESWEVGTGRFSNSPQITDGVSWKSTDGETSWSLSPLPSGSTSSYFGLASGGGIWLSSSQHRVTQSFNLASDLDTNLDVSSLIVSMSSGDITNYGFIIKRTDILESASIDYGDLKYFSKDTHTIYPPSLLIKWDDSVQTTSGDADSTTVIGLKNNKGSYKRDSKIKMRLKVRDQFPSRNFVLTSGNTSTSYLPTSSYYSLIDAHNENIVIPFDTNYTKLSSDSSGMYFNLYTRGLQPERYYRLAFKVITSEEEFVIDNNEIFKITR